MNNRIEVDLRKSVNTAVKETAGDLLGMMVLVLICGFAFAPWFSPFFRYYLESKYKINEDIAPRMALVNSEMVKINRRLWLVAIISWAIIIYLACR